MTKTKQKILGLALSVSMIASCFTGMSVPASADGDTSTYTITIPSTLTVSGSGWNATSGISAKGTLATGKKLTVTASSANGFKLKSGSNEVGYTLATASSDTTATTSWEFTELSNTETTKSLGIIVENYDSKPAGTYTDTVTFTASVENAAQANPYADNDIGDVVTFGSYSWYIIGKSDNGVTLLMQNNLENKKYNDSWGVTWETCSLRTYLNGDFYNSFSPEDKAKIVETRNTNPNNPAYNTSGGNDTDDYIYLLSIAEANSLNSSIRNIGSSWWLRSPGYDSDTAAIVDSGNVNTLGMNVLWEYGVRPTLKLEF